MNSRDIRQFIAEGTHCGQSRILSAVEMRSSDRWFQVADEGLDLLAVVESCKIAAKEELDPEFWAFARGMLE